MKNILTLLTLLLSIDAYSQEDMGLGGSYFYYQFEGVDGRTKINNHNFDIGQIYSFLVVLEESKGVYPAFWYGIKKAETFAITLSCYEECYMVAKLVENNYMHWVSYTIVEQGGDEKLVYKTHGRFQIDECFFPSAKKPWWKFW